jgi:hypothetical protein
LVADALAHDDVSEERLAFLDSLDRGYLSLSLSLSAQESACCGEGRELFIILIFFSCCVS